LSVVEESMRAARFTLLIPLSLACFFSGATGSGSTAAGGKVFTFSPVLTYSPETGVGGGVVALLAPPPRYPGLAGGGSRFRASLFFTSEEQYSAELSAGVPLGRRGYRFAGNVGYRKWPFDYYGIGNDAGREPVAEVLQESVYTTLSAGRSIGDGVSLWMNYRLSGDGIDWPGGAPPPGETVPGSQGGLLSGLGLSLFWDKRDSASFPRSGHTFQAVTFAHGELLGSEYTFSRLSVDARKYAPLFRSQALAFQLYGAFSGGDPPFYEMPRLGGPNLLRGYYEGRFRDRQLVAFQAEYRAPLISWLGVVVFAGTGVVANTPSELELRELKYSYGFGFRLGLGKTSRVPLRLDFGFGEDSQGIYLTLFEAF
jgi:outer membrane protein assembly factor BamA